MSSYEILDLLEYFNKKILERNFLNNVNEDDDKLQKLVNECIRLNKVIKEVREYITSYESIETIQQFDHNKNNKDLDYSTIDEMTRRYMIVHDKVLEILEKGE